MLRVWTTRIPLGITHKTSLEIPHNVRTDRHGVLQGEVAKHAKELFYDCAKANDWWVDKLGVEPDHVHMLVRLPPRYSVPEAVQLLKGGSSKVLREQHPDLETWLWGDSFWGQGYFAETVGRMHEDIMKEYIDEQTQHAA